MSYLNIVLTGKSDSGKTNIFAVQTLDGGVLGRVSWFGPWRKYTFSPVPNVTFDANCLDEIANFCRSTTNTHKGKA